MANIFSFTDPPQVEYDIDESKLVCFVHSPKCAGKSIRTTLHPYTIPKVGGSDFLHVHTSLATVKRYIPFTTVTSVRNPWKREVSAYEYSREQYEIMGSESNDLLRFAHDCEFEEFITLKYEAYKGGNFWAQSMPIFGYKKYEPMSMWLPQQFFAFVNGDPQQGKADYFLKVESLQEDMDTLLQSFNLNPLPVEHVNASKNTLQNKNYQDYYTSTTKDFVYNMEKPLIKEFKYEF